MKSNAEFHHVLCMRSAEGPSAGAADTRASAGGLVPLIRWSSGPPREQHVKAKRHGWVPRLVSFGSFGRPRHISPMMVERVQVNRHGFV